MSCTSPTPEQSAKIDELKALGYTWNKQKSVSAAGVVMENPKNTDDFWFFGLDGEIMHKPNGYCIKTN